jgi:hypothetical protein
LVTWTSLFCFYISNSYRTKLASAGISRHNHRHFRQDLCLSPDFFGDFQMKSKPSIFTGPVPATPATRTRLVDLVHPSHPLISLAREMNWPEFDLQFGCYYSDDQGRPALPTRLLAGLHYLKYAHKLGAGFNFRKLMAIVHVGLKRISERFCLIIP